MTAQQARGAAVVPDDAVPLRELAEKLDASLRVIQKRAAKGSLPTWEKFDDEVGKPVRHARLQDALRYWKMRPEGATSSERVAPPIVDIPDQAPEVATPSDPERTGVATPDVEGAPHREDMTRALAVLSDRHKGEVGELRRELEVERRRGKGLGRGLLLLLPIAAAGAGIAWRATSEAAETRVVVRELVPQLTDAEQRATSATLEAAQAKTAAQDAARSLEAAQSELGALLVQVATERSVRRLVASTATAARLVGELLIRV